MIKNQLLITVIAVFTFSTIKAQREYYDFFDFHTNWIKFDPVYKQENKLVKQIEVQYKRPNKTKVSTNIIKYREDGKLIEISSLNKKGVEVPWVNKSYDFNGYEARVIRHKRGKLKSTIVFTRQKNGEILSYEQTNKKGKLIAKGTWKYNSDNCLIESVNYKKGGVKIRNKWVYEYYDKCKKSKTTLYKGNGKVKNVWTFDCKAEGEKLTKKKNETQICHWDQSSADYLTKVYQTFDEKGKIIKYVTKYTIADTLPLEHSQYNEDDKLRFKDTYDKSFQKPLSHYFYKKGKLNYESAYTYKDSLQTSYQWMSKGIVRSRHEFNYNEKNLLSTQKWFRKNKLQTTTTLTYTFR